MPDEPEADLGAFMQQVDEPYIDEPAGGIYSLRQGTGINYSGTSGSGALSLGGRHGYDYVPKYLVKAAEEMVENHYKPEKKTYQRNGQKIEYEEEPINPVPSPAQQEAAKKFAAVLEEVRREPVAQAPPIQTVQPSIEIGKLPQAQERPIPAFAGTPYLSQEDKLRAMVKEIARLKGEQETLKKIREAKLESLKLKWNNISAGIKAKHPYLTALVEQGAKGAIGLGKAAIPAASSLAKGIGSLAMQISDPYRGQRVGNAFDQITGNLLGDSQPKPMQPFQPLQVNNSSLAQEAEKLRLERSIITQRAQLANQRAIMAGKPQPYPSVPTYATHEKKQRKKSLSEIVRQVEKEKLQAELDRVKKLATA